MVDSEPITLRGRTTFDARGFRSGVYTDESAQIAMARSMPWCLLDLGLGFVCDQSTSAAAGDGTGVGTREPRLGRGIVFDRHTTKSIKAQVSDQKGKFMARSVVLGLTTVVSLQESGMRRPQLSTSHRATTPLGPTPLLRVSRNCLAMLTSRRLTAWGSPTRVRWAT